MDYTCTSLGSAPGVPTNYGGLTVKYNNPNVLLIGGTANSSQGRIYQVNLVRGTNNHIVGFSGSATVYPTPTATIGQNNDGGVAFGPGNVLFVTRYPNNQIEQSKPGSVMPDKVVNLGTIPGGGVTPSVGALAFVPPGFPGAGQLKLASYNAGVWYTAALAPDANGTYDVTSITPGPAVAGGPEGIGFVPPGSPHFPPNSALIALYSANKVITAPLDANGDPIMASAQDVVTGLNGAEGTFIDPLTGDLLFTTFGGQILRISGFGRAPAPVGVVSRKTHGALGAFDIPLLGGNAIECRNGTPTGGDYSIVFTFAAPVSVGGAFVASTDNVATAEPPVVSGTTVTVNLHNVANAQRINVVLTNVSDGMRADELAIPFGILVGDTNANGSVNATDIGQAKSQSGQAVTTENFRTDVNVSGGTINASDIGFVKSRAGTLLP